MCAGKRSSWEPKALDRLYGDCLEDRMALPIATVSSMYEKRLLMVYRAVHGRWPLTILGTTVDALSLHDVQFGLCEWDKYERYRLKQGKVRKYGERTCIFTNFHRRDGHKRKARTGYPDAERRGGQAGRRGLSQPVTTHSRGTATVMALASTPVPKAIASSGQSRTHDVLSESDAEMSVAEVVCAARRGRLV